LSCNPALFTPDPVGYHTNLDQMIKLLTRMHTKA